MNIKKILTKALEETFLHLSYELDDLSLTFSNRVGEADFQCNSAFAIAKKMHTSPEVVATAIVSIFLSKLGPADTIIAVFPS